VPVSQQAQQHADKTEQNKHTTITYIPTGIKYLDDDRLIRGLRKGKTIVVAGYTNHGKTVVSMSIAYNVSKSGHNVIVFNVADGTKHDVFSRFVAMEGGINFSDVSANNVTQNQYGKYIGALSTVTKMSNNLHIQSEKNMRIDTLEAQAKAIAAKMPVDLIVVDYIGRLTVEPFIDDPKTGRKIANPDNATKVLRMAHCSGRLIKLGEMLNCAMMVNAQINRQGAGKMPEVGHIKDSGNIGEDADLVLLVYKEGLDNYGYNFPHQIQIKIGKNKVNGNFGTALTTVDPQSTYVTSQVLNR
jgi:replicative DNA helicase